MDRTALLAVGLAAALGVAAPASAQYGAIAYDRTNCASGRSWNYDDPRGADDRAMSECSALGSRCRVLVRVGPGECGAVAATDDCDGDGWAVRSSISAAQIVALEQCRRYNPRADCGIKNSVCSSR